MGATEDDKRLLMCRPPLAAQEHPWLLIAHGKHRQLQTFYSVSEDRCYVRKIPQLCNKIVCSSDASGWLVLEHLYSDECFLFNIISMEQIQLPVRESDYDECVLTSPPSDQNCRVVFTSNKNHSLVFCRPGDSEFVEQSLEHGDELSCATAFEGKFYGLRQDKTLVVLDFSAPKPQFRQIISESLGKPCPPGIMKTQTYIFESCGELLMVQKMWHGLFFDEVFGFLIFRVNFSTNTCVEVKSMSKEMAIFLNAYGAMSISATNYDGIRGNSIYFTEAKDRCLYVFDLEYQRISIFLPSPTVLIKLTAAIYLHEHCPPDIMKSQTYIIESCGELLLLQKMWHGLFLYEVFGFLIFRVDFSTSTFVDVKSMSEGTAIFLDAYDVMSISATKYNGIRGNSIYFTEGKDGCLYVFDLEYQRISISLPSPTVSRSGSALHWVMIRTETQ